MTGKVSDGPTSYAVLQQVPGANLEHILTDFIKERLRCTHLGGSGVYAPPRNFWIFYSLKPPHSWVSESFRQDISECSTWNFFPFKISIYDRFSWKVANRCGSAPEFYCDFFRLRGDYLRNKSADLIKWPLFLSRLRPGKILSPVVFSISLGAMYLGMFFHVLYFGELFWRRVVSHPIHPPPLDPPMFLRSLLSFSVPVHLFKSFIEHQDSLNSFS